MPSCRARLPVEADHLAFSNMGHYQFQTLFLDMINFVVWAVLKHGLSYSNSALVSWTAAGEVPIHQKLHELQVSNFCDWL